MKMNVMNASLLHQFINEHVKQSLSQNLLTEEVFGKQAFVYHGSNSPPDTLLPILLADKFTPGGGDMYGKGMYCVYSPDPKQQTFKGFYGRHVYKLKVNLYGFVIFDAAVCQKVYGSNLSPSEQLGLLGVDTEAVEKLLQQPGFDTKDLKKKLARPGSMTSDRALKYYKILSQHVKGIIFTGSRDGQVAVIYDPASVVPVAWKKVKNKSWTRVGKEQLRPAVQRSIAGSHGKFEVGRFNYDPLTALKKGVLNFPEDVDLSNTSLTSLPAGLTVGGYLNLWGTLITSLPAGLKVGGELELSDTPITSLPADLKVGGDLNLWGTKITSLPADLKVGGSLHLSDTPITSLPAGLKVGFDLDLRGTKITSLPAGLKVGADLNLWGTKITSLPADLKVGGNIYKDF